VKYFNNETGLKTDYSCCVCNSGNEYWSCLFCPTETIDF